MILGNWRLTLSAVLQSLDIPAVISWENSRPPSRPNSDQSPQFLSFQKVSCMNPWQNTQPDLPVLAFLTYHSWQLGNLELLWRLQLKPMLDQHRVTLVFVQCPYFPKCSSICRSTRVNWYSLRVVLQCDHQAMPICQSDYLSFSVAGGAHSSSRSRIIVYPVQRAVRTNRITLVPDDKLLPDPSKHLPDSDLKVILRSCRSLGTWGSLLRSWSLFRPFLAYGD